MKKMALILSLAFFVFACGDATTDQKGSDDQNNATTTENKSEKPEADPKGIGEIKNVVLNSPLDEEMIAAGKSTYELKCAACHKLSDQRVVGPGWLGITKRRTPEWIMNMTLNVDVMLEEDPQARELLKECLVRMPNQNLTQGDSRDVLEFMFSNDAQTE
jgi:cytochrome c5